MSDSLVKKFISFTSGNVIALFFSVMTVPIVTRALTPEQYGRTTMFTLSTSILSTIMLMGCEQSFVRFFYEENRDSRTGLLYKCLKIPLCMCCSLIIIMILFREQISELLFAEYNLYAVILVILQAFFLTLNNFALLVVRMQQKGNKYSVLLIANKALNLGLIVCFVFVLKNNYLSFLCATVITNILVTVSAVGWERRFWNIRNKNPFKMKNSMADIWYFAFPLLFTALTNWLFQSIDKISIRYWGNYTELGTYSSAYTLVGLLNVVQASFTVFWTPVAFEHFERDPGDKTFFEKVNSIITYIMLSMAVLIILFKDMIVLFLGKEYKDAAFIMPFLVFMPIMYTISETTQIGINFYKKSKYHLAVALLSLLADVSLMIVLIPALGARGAAISTGVAYITFFACRTFFSLKYYQADFKIKKIVISVVLVVGFALYATFFNVGTVYILLGIAILGMIACLYKNVLCMLVSYCMKLAKRA